MGPSKGVKPDLGKPLLSDLCTVRLLCTGNPAQDRHRIPVPESPTAPSVPGKPLNKVDLGLKSDPHFTAWCILIRAVGDSTDTPDCCVSTGTSHI